MKESIILERPPNLEVATRLTAAGFEQPTSAGLETDVENHLQAEIQLTYRQEDEDLAYAVLDVYKVGSRSILYLSGVIVDPSMQGMGVGEQLIDYARDQSAAEMLAFRTQSPRMYALGQRLTTDLYPSAADREHIPEEYLQIGDDLASQLGGVFPFQPRCYNGESLYGAKQTHDTKEDLMDRLCDASQGDAVLCLGEFKDEI